MRKFTHYRNRVEYEGYVVEEDTDEWREIQRVYGEIERWANDNEYIDRRALEKIES